MGKVFPTIPIGTKNRTPARQFLSPHKPYTQEGNTVNPKLQIWKTSAGHMLELDDTGSDNPAPVTKSDGTVVQSGDKTVSAASAATAQTSTEYNKSKSAYSATDDNSGIRITTKKGHFLHLVDQQGIESIYLSDFKGNYLWIDSTRSDGYLMIRNDYRETIVNNKTTNVAKSHIFHIGEMFQVNSAGPIQLNSSEDISVSTPKSFVMDAKMGMKINGTTGVEISSPLVSALTATTKVSVGSATHTAIDSGALMTLDAAGIVYMKGSLVIINPPGPLPV